MGAANASGSSGGMDAAVITTTYDDYAPQTGGDSNNGYAGMAGRTNGYTGGAASGTLGGGGAGAGGNGGNAGIIGVSAAAGSGAGGGAGSLFGGNGGSGSASISFWQNTVSQTFTANGTWVAPAGYNGAVICAGLGGGGGSASGSTAGAGAANLQYSIFQAKSGQSYNISIGAGGSNTGGNGGTTTIVNASTQVFGAIGGKGSTGTSAGRDNATSTSLTTPDVYSGGNQSGAGNTGYINTFIGGAASSTYGGGGASALGVGGTGDASGIAPGSGAGAGGFVGGNGSVTLYFWPDGGSVCETYTANGSWVCPSGVTKALLYGFGGGGGGGASSNWGGGGGSIATLSLVNVVPGTSYSVTVGAAGSGAISVLTNGGSGGATIFGSLYSTLGGQCGVNGSGGASDTTHATGDALALLPGWGGYHVGGSYSYQGFAGGAASGNFGGGGGGPMGPGASGNSLYGTTPTAPTTANSGAGGGCGNTDGLSTGGPGSAGRLIVCWWV